MKEGKYRYLFHNMALFTVSSFVSKVLVFCLVPFYTSVLTEAEYGVADVMQTTLLLLVPLLSVNAGEAALRFGLDHVKDRDRILLYGLKKVIRSVLITAGISLLLAAYLYTGLPRPGFMAGRNMPLLLILFAVLYICDSFYEFMLLYCQGTEQVQIMITGSVSCTLLVIMSNLFFLLVISMGLLGYLLAQMIAFLGSFLIMFLLIDGKSGIKQAIQREKAGAGADCLENEVTTYGSSMLLYSTASWVNNAIDRYYIILMLGASQNGLYGAAYKIPAILQTVQRIFAQAWQMSAVKEYKGADREKFFSEMYRTYEAVLFMGCAGIIWLLRIIAALLFRKGFYEAWILVPPLLVSVIFGALEGFLGSIALAFRDGKSMGRATGVGALVNIILNYFGIMRFNTFGAALATLCSYFVMFALAFVFVRKHVKLEVKILRDIWAIMLLMIESLLVIFNMKNYFWWNAGIVLLLLFLFRGEAMLVLRKLMQRKNAD